MCQKKRCLLQEVIIKNFPGDSVFLYPNLGILSATEGELIFKVGLSPSNVRSSLVIAPRSVCANVAEAVASVMASREILKGKLFFVRGGVIIAIANLIALINQLKEITDSDPKPMSSVRSSFLEPLRINSRRSRNRF